MLTRPRQPGFLEGGSRNTRGNFINFIEGHKEELNAFKNPLIILI